MKKSKVVGYKFIPYTLKKGFLRKRKTIMDPDILSATNTFIRMFLGLGNNISVVHLHIRTVNLEHNISGRGSLVCDELLQLNNSGQIIKFKIEKIVGDI